MMTEEAPTATVRPASQRRTKSPPLVPQPADPTIRSACADVAPGLAPDSSMLGLQRAIGNAAIARLVAGDLRRRRTSVQRAPGSPAPAAGVAAPSPAVPSAAPAGGNRVAFVRDEGLNLRTAPDQA